MSAFNVCTKSTADSSWDYSNNIFISIENNVPDFKIDINSKLNIEESINSNCVIYTKKKEINNLSNTLKKCCI